MSSPSLGPALERLAQLRSRRPPRVPDLFGQVKEVVVVASSSRGGSSVFMEMLRHSSDLLHFRAEINPFLVMAGLSHPDMGTGSDALDARHLGDLEVLQTEMAQDVGNLRSLEDADQESFARSLTWRLLAQWPCLDVREEEVRECLTQALSRLADEEEGPATPRLQVFHAHFLRAIRRIHPQVNPYFYDLDDALLARQFPDLAVPSGPPSPVVLEEPPFVPIAPWRLASSEEFARPLIIKTPSNAYRLPFLKGLFPKARFRILHLVRNPAAAINGLYDGWRYRGFHSHFLGEALDIRGYSDDRPQDAMWWKYDLPPGWQEWRDRPLEEVCAFQWRSAHQSILEFLGDQDCLRIRFEDLVGPVAKRTDTFVRLCAWLGIPFSSPLRRVVEKGLPPVMATARPRQRRWFERREQIEPLCALPAVKDVAGALGYRDSEEWI